MDFPIKMKTPVKIDGKKKIGVSSTLNVPKQ